MYTVTTTSERLDALLTWLRERGYCRITREDLPDGRIRIEAEFGEWDESSVTA